MIELLLQADRLLTVDLVDAADAIYRKVAEADPRNAIAVVGMARCALARSDDHEAYRLAARALAIDPQNDMARRMEARLDEVLRTRGEVPGQGVATVGTADAAPGAVPEAVPPVKHRWPATPTTVRPAAGTPTADAGATMAAGASGAQPAGALPPDAPDRRSVEAVEAPAPPSDGTAPASTSTSPSGSSWAARIHHEDPPAPARPPAPSRVSSVPSAPSVPPSQAGAPDQSSGTPGQSGTQASPVAPASPSKRSLLDRLRGR